mmetsp:Transcript_8685/g.9795  ORF Transcript_8685/g.9795 Transcript_8685/m.9795 type:complete len:92 (+) Transcript_8685:41-316(+)
MKAFALIALLFAFIIQFASAAKSKWLGRPFGFGRPFGYGGFYRPWGYGGFYRPWGYGGFYRPYGYGYGYPYGYGYGYPYLGYGGCGGYGMC